MTVGPGVQGGTATTASASTAAVAGAPEETSQVSPPRLTWLGTAHASTVPGQ